MKQTDLNKLKNKDKLSINNNTYEVLYVQEDVDIKPESLKKLKTENYKLTMNDYEKYLEIALYDIKSLSLSPTHSLRYYKDKDLLIFFDRGVTIKLNVNDIEKV